jgi:hypothetical protein
LPLKLTELKHMKSLKHLAGVLLFALLSTLSTFAATSVTLGWNANPTSENVTAYIVYYGNSAGVLPYSTNAGMNLNVTVVGLTPGMNWYFTVKAKNDVGLESDPSDQVWLTMPGDDVVVKTIGATNVTRTNVALVGVVTNVPTPYSCFFEYAVGTTWSGTGIMTTPLVSVPGGTSYTHTATIPVVATNYVCRLIVTNTGFLYISAFKAFKTVPPSKPTQIKFETKIIETASLTNPHWKEVMTASFTKDYPPQGMGFFRSVMAYSLVTNYPPGELVVEPLLADAELPPAPSDQVEPLCIQAKLSLAVPATPGQ